VKEKTMKRTKKLAMPDLFAVTEPAPVAVAEVNPIGAGVTDDEAIVTARLHLARAGATDLDDCSATVDGDVVLFSRKQVCVASLRYTNTGHTAAWATTREGAIEWTTRVVPFESAATPGDAAKDELPASASSEDDRFHIEAARNHLTSVGAVSMHQYAGWIVGDTVWFNRIGEDGGGLNAWLSYDDSGPARGAWMTFTPLAHGGTTAEWSTWARDDLAAPPLDAFKSKKGRVFEVGDGVHARKNAADEVGSDTYPIFYGKQPAGSLFRGDGYGRTATGALRWHASMNPLRWAPFVELPRGEGYDVAAFDSAAECLEAWAVSADQIIDAQEAQAQRDQADGIRAPVCPRCLGVDPGKPGGKPEEPHSGPFTAELCGACAAATKSTLMARLSMPASPKTPEHEDPATIAGEVVAELRGALGEMAKLTEELSGKKALPTLTLSVIDGFAFFVIEDPTVPPVRADAALDAFKLSHPVSYDELYEVAYKLGKPEGEDQRGLCNKLMDTLGRANLRAEAELGVLRQANADVLGITIDELDAKLAAQRVEAAATKAAAKAARGKAPPVIEAKAERGPAKRRSKAQATEEPLALAEAPAEVAEAPVTPQPVADDAAPAAEPVDTWETPATDAAPESDAASSSTTKIAMRKLTDRQRELLAVVRVEDDRAIFGSDDHVPDWDALKKVMTALGGTWRKGSKKIKGGFVFPDGTDVAEVIFLAQTSGEVLDPRLVGFIQTPEWLARKLVDWIDPEDERNEDDEPLLFLEPEAGQGRIVKAMMRVTGAKIACYELLDQNREKLLEMAEDADNEIKIVGADFMQADPDKATPVDGVAMNPPFENRADIRHVRHAIRFVKAGGKLAAVVSAGAMFRTDKETTDFRAFINSHGTIEALPDGSFLDEGTGVRTAIVRITACPSCALHPSAHPRPLF